MFKNILRQNAQDNMENYLQISYFIGFFNYYFKACLSYWSLGEKPCCFCWSIERTFFLLLESNLRYCIYVLIVGDIINRVQLKRVCKRPQNTVVEKKIQKNKKKGEGGGSTRHKLGVTPGLVPSCALMTNIRAERSQKLQNGPSFPEYLKQ